MGEPVAARLQDIREDPLSTEHQLAGHLRPEDEPQGGCRHRYRCGPVERCAQGGGQLGVGGRVGCRGVDRPGHAGVAQAVLDRADLVLKGDPAPELPPRSGATAQAEPEQRELSAEGAAGPAEDDARP